MAGIQKPDNGQDDILYSMLAQEQDRLGQEEKTLWKKEKGEIWTRRLFVLWSLLSFLVIGELFLIQIFKNTLPSPEKFATQDFIVTPVVVWFVAGLFGFLTRKLLKQPYWTWKCTVAAVIGGSLVVIFPMFQGIVLYLYLMLVVMPCWYIYSFFRNL